MSFFVELTTHRDQSKAKRSRFRALPYGRDG